MLKRTISIILALTLALAFVAACRGEEPAPAPAPVAEAPAAPADEPAPAPADEPPPADEPAPADDWKIGIITGTVSQGEEEFQAAQKMIATYGADRIITATYPDRFNDEIETTISQVLSLADQGAQAIVFVQAVPGATAAIMRTRERYPDMLFIAGVAAEPPREIAEAADIVMLVDEIGMGTVLPRQAASQGAKTFIHYSFPRHLGYETIAARRELFIQTCEELGIEYVDVTAPDPTGDAGMSGAQQFIVEDVPRQVEEYGKDTVFFSTNCGMQEPLIRTVVEQQAIYSQPCCPSPYHGFPAALNISLEGHEGDVAYMVEQTRIKVAEAGNTGRVSNWPLPVNMLMIEAGTDYAIKYLAGETNGKLDQAALQASVDKISAEYGGTGTSLSLYADDDGEIGNFYMILCDYINY